MIDALPPHRYHGDREWIVDELTRMIIGKNRPETTSILMAFSGEARLHGIDPKPIWMDALLRRTQVENTLDKPQ